MQNYLPLTQRHELTFFGSRSSATGICQRPDLTWHMVSPETWSLEKGSGTREGLTLIKLSSPVDLPDFPYKMPVLNRLFTDAHYLFGLEEKLKGYDIAHCAETYYCYTQQCLNAKAKGYVKKVVSTVWENIPFNNEGIRGRKEFKKRALKEIDLFLAVTEKAKEALILEGCDPKKIEVVRMGVDIDKFKINPPIRRAKLKILFVGRLVEEKGILDLKAAVKILKQKNIEFNLTIVGNGPLKKQILSKLNEVDIEIKQIPYEEMPGVYQAADIFVLPSKPAKHWQEQYGMALIEAMASGLPIITTKSVSIQEVVGKAALLVAPGNIKDLAKVIEKLLKDKKERERLGGLGRLRAERYFDAKKTALKIEEIYMRHS